jgi:hypothetical protein
MAKNSVFTFSIQQKYIRFFANAAMKTGQEIKTP